MNNNIKSFSIVDFPKDGDNYGNFTASIPKQAANSVFSFLYHVMNKNNKNNDFTGKFIVFVIKNNDNGKMYKYIGNRIKLKNPVKKIINGKETIYHYKNVIGKYNNKLDNL